MRAAKGMARKSAWNATGLESIKTVTARIAWVRGVYAAGAVMETESLTEQEVNTWIIQ